LRIAFDDIKFKEEYIKKIEWAVEYNLIHLSNYILYNYNDTPEDFYERLKINTELNERLGIKIFSFPMKYIPIKNKDRIYVGKYWNPKFLRGIQCILNVTHGVVGPSSDEFKNLLLMPDRYIMFREKHKNNGAKEWVNKYHSLSDGQLNEFHTIVKNQQYDFHSKYDDINKLLIHYKKEFGAFGGQYT